MVPYLVKLAKAQRAVWMADVNSAIYGGGNYSKRVQELTAELLGTDSQELDRARELDELAALSRQVGGEQGKLMLRRVEYLRFCDKMGLEA